MGLEVSFEGVHSTADFSSVNIILTYILSRTVSELSRSVGQVIAFVCGCIPRSDALVRVEHLNSQL